MKRQCGSHQKQKRFTFKAAIRIMEKAQHQKMKERNYKVQKHT